MHDIKDGSAIGLRTGATQEEAYLVLQEVEVYDMESE